MIVRNSATGAAQRVHIATSGAVDALEPLPVIEEGWLVVGYGDFARNGKSSLLLSNAITAGAKLWTLAGSGRVVAQPVPLAEVSSYIAACADFNHDGRMDAFYRSFAGGESIILLDGTTKVSRAELPPAGFQRALVAAADFTGDSSIDLLWYDFETDNIVMWVMDGTSIQRVRRWPAH